MAAGYTIMGNGPPVVLIHGSMNSKSQWIELSHVLRDKFTVIAPDLSGYGETPYPRDPSGHALTNEVELIRRILSSLIGENTPAHFVAHSYGGAVAMCYASQYPAEVLSLALYEPMANHLLLDFDQERILTEGQRLIGLISDQVTRGETFAGAKTFMDYFSGRDVFSMLSPKAQKTLSAYVSKMLIDYRTTIDTPLTIDDYRGIENPFCIITGDNSTEISLAISQILLSQISSIEWVQVQGNHMTPITHPHKVNTVVIEWLNRVTHPQPRLSA